MGSLTFIATKHKGGGSGGGRLKLVGSRLTWSHDICLLLRPIGCRASAQFSKRFSFMALAPGCSIHLTRRSAACFARSVSGFCTQQLKIWFALLMERQYCMNTSATARQCESKFFSMRRLMVTIECGVLAPRAWNYTARLLFYELLV